MKCVLDIYGGDVVGEDDDLKKADEAAKSEAERTIKAAQASNDSCGRAKESHRFYGMIFGGVGFVGFIGILIGAVFTLIGFRKKKTA